MFQKPAFGSTTANFGSFNSGTSTASPFGGFKPTTGTSAFGAPPAFGAATSTQPTTGGGLFGTTNTTGGLFGGTTASTSTAGFGASTSGFGFGAAQPATGGLFGNTSAVGGGGGLFGTTHNQTAFGAKPTGFGFGGTTTTGAATSSLFGATPATGTGLFGQQNNTLGGGGLFSNNTAGAFGQQQQQQSGTAHVKYNPVVGTDVVVKSGTSQSVNIKHHCITCMKEYENKSLEELRLEDYVAGRKGNTSGVFGGFQQQTENKPLFGNTSFGQPATTSAPSVFGGGTLGGAGGFAAQPSSFSFAGNASTTNTTGLFGANKPAFGAAPTTGGTGLFGATTTQAPTFGTNTSSFGFGTTTLNQQQSGGGLLFGGAKPATTGFGTTLPASTGFGAFGSAGVFGAKTQAPTFGTQAPAFGALSTGAFGTTTSSAGGLFGGNTSFGKPTTAPTFGFGNTQQTGLGTGLGGALGANSFAAKPAAPAFGLGSTMFSQPAQNTTFKTGLEGGLGGGMFGQNTSLGGGLGMGMGSMLGNQPQGMNNSLSGSSAGGNVHEQILTLAARPYGDSPLFKDLLPDSSTTAEDVLKPTNPAAVKAVLDSCNSAAYRVSSPNSLRLTVTPRTSTRRDDKKSLFDGLEESDASLEDKLCLKPSRKRLVLRPNQKANDSHHDSIDHANDTGRSLEDQAQANGGPPAREMASEQPNTDEVDRRQDDYASMKNAKTTAWQADVSSGSDRHGSWLSSPKMPWSEKEKPIDNEPTPRLYPNLDKEIQYSERRASWLTSKPLRPPLGNNPEAAENSVRELAVRNDRSHDKENIDTLSLSAEDENVAPRELPPHPTGVKLTRPGYYTIPSLDEMIAYMRSDGSCVVPHLTIGRKNYGNVYYDCEIDVAGMDLDSLVHFLNKEVIVYPEDSVKPPLGEGLNRRAYVTLDRVWPRDKSEKRAITEPERLLKMEYESKLRRVCDKHNTKFVEYRPQTGSWVFRVEHFSKYGLTDSDEEDDPHRQLVASALQASSAPPAPKPPVPAPTVGLGGLGPSAPLVAEDNLFAMQQTSLNLLNGAAKAFEMDTTEDNTESQSLYLDNKAFGVKSPTSELARLENRQSHNVQLMKASLYADTEMEDDTSISTGDQLVPISAPLLSVPSLPPSAMREDRQISEIEAPQIEETPMKPLIVRPHTIVLKYHRKVPPFRQTIAGRLDASYISDMSVCRARHSRVGFGPSGALTFTTSYDSVNDLPRSAELSELGKYVSGRSANDWSEPLLVRMALGQPEKDDGMLEVLKKHLATLLEHSTFTQSSESQCARLNLSVSASDRRAVLSQYLRDASTVQTRYKFGVSGGYCYEVWRLCDALWGADLENDGVPGTDPLSTVNRHRSFLDWLKTAVAEITDQDLSKPTHGEKEDEADGHSARLWTLLLGGRILEACKVAKEHGDLNMAILIAQAAGDPTFRSLITRQLTLWRECGADSLMSSHRWATLHLIAGQSSPRDKLLETDWLRALHATARYLCPYIPSLEQVTRTYEGFFTDENQDGDGDIDLSLIENDEMCMRLPLPPYVTHYDVTVVNNGKQRRVLDLRYELIRARAFNSRPKLRPASYTPDPLDYSLCFLLGTWFGNPTIESITGIADQLEASGNWHLAVQALSYHPNDVARGHLIRGVLSRHAPAKADTADLKARLELIRRLKVPEQWLLLAQAHRAKYERLPAVEAEHLVGAGQWNAAHKVLLEELLPEAVLADDLQSIAPLLEKMNEAAQRHEVSGWDNGGQALHSYLHVCDEIRGLVSSAEAQRDRASVHARLEALRPKVAAACRALGGLQPKSVGVRFARAEMGARLVQCTLAAGEPPTHLAQLLRALNLPPDTTHSASHKISSLLASRAAESCGVSAVSPSSSRAIAS